MNEVIMKIDDRRLKLSNDLLSCTKWLHTLMNLVCIGIGVAVLYAASLAYLNKADDLFLMYNYAPLNVIIITIYAAALVVTGILGIISLIRKSFNGILTALIILLILLLCAINYPLWRALKEDYTEKGDVFTQLFNEIKNYVKHEEVIDLLQQKLSCCGARAFTEWGNEIPSSCCPPGNVCDRTNPLLYRKGCFHDLATLIAHYNWMILIGLGFLGAIEVVTMFASGMLLKFIAFAKLSLKDIEEAIRIPRIPTAPGSADSKPEPQTMDPMEQTLTEDSEVTEEGKDDAKQEAEKEAKAEAEEEPKEEPKEE